jgi:hypothetical protein
MQAKIPVVRLGHVEDWTDCLKRAEIQGEEG